jgi:hypothetical protein
LAAKHDIEQGVSAEVDASRDDVLDALSRAGDPLNEHKRLEVRDEDEEYRATVALWVQPLFRSDAPMKQSWVLSVELESPEPGVLCVETALSEFRTSQSTMLGIPLGPKELLGRREFLLYLDALSNELGALDPHADVVRRRN